MLVTVNYLIEKYGVLAVTGHWRLFSVSGVKGDLP